MDKKFRETTYLCLEIKNSRQENRSKLSFYSPVPFMFSWFLWINLYARPHENAKTMEIRQHVLQGMRCLMYDIIVFENLRFRPSTRKR